MVEFIFGWGIFILLCSDEYFSLDLSLAYRLEVILVCDNFIFIDDHVKFMDGNFVLFSNEYFEAVNVGDYVDSEESLIVLLNVLDLEGFHLLDSDVLLDIVDFFVSIDDFFDKSDHFLNAFDVIFLRVYFGFLKDSLSENLDEVDLKIFFQHGTS
jgi:hypothetical protein